MTQNEQYFEIAGLIGKFLRDEVSPEEAARLEAWIAEDEEHKKLWERLTDPLYMEEGVQYWQDNRNKEINWKRLSGRISGKRPVVRRMLRYAAVLLPFLLVCGAGWYFFRYQEQKSKDVPVLAAHILPQGKVAQLILANGKKINLTDSLPEAITEYDGIKLHNR